MKKRVAFRWSFIYQEEMHLPPKFSYDRSKSEKFVNKFIESIEKDWKNIEGKIFKIMESSTRLNWKDKTLTCYVLEISSFGPISDPLTIPIKFKVDDKTYELSKERFIDMLVRELIHIFLTQNSDKLGDYLSYINSKYKNYSQNTALHVPVHAIHKEIFDRLFDKERFEKEITASEYYSDYRLAWNIVTKRGSKKIISELREHIKD